MPAAGARVVVPVGPRTLTGVVLGEAAAADTAYTIKPIKQVARRSRVRAAGRRQADRVGLGVLPCRSRGDARGGAAAARPDARASIDSRPSASPRSPPRALMPSSVWLRTASKPSNCPRLGKRQVEALASAEGRADGLAMPALTERGITERGADTAQDAGTGGDSRGARRPRSVRARRIGDPAAGAT